MAELRLVAAEELKLAFAALLPACKVFAVGFVSALLILLRTVETAHELSDPRTAPALPMASVGAAVEAVLGDSDCCCW